MEAGRSEAEARAARRERTKGSGNGVTVWQPCQIRPLNVGFAEIAGVDIAIPM